MRFLKAKGCDIIIEEVFQVEEDSSSDATSTPIESSATDEAKTEAQARFNTLRSHCAKTLTFSIGEVYPVAVQLQQTSQFSPLLIGMQ